MLATEFCNNGTYLSRSCKIDFASGWVGNESFDDAGGVFATVLNDIDHARRKSCVCKELANELVCGGTQF